MATKQIDTSRRQATHFRCEMAHDAGGAGGQTHDASYVCGMEEWRQEWRRNGGAVMATTFLVGGSWVGASQSFVSERAGQLVHPSPYGWMFWICLAGFSAGVYLVFMTYFDWLPMPGRKGAKNRDFRDQIREMHEQLSERGNRNDPITIRFEPGEFDMPIVAPMDYQMRQLKLAIAKIRKSGLSQIDYWILGSVLGRMDRPDTDPVFEPLAAFDLKEALSVMVEEGELEQGDGWWRLT